MGWALIIASVFLFATLFAQAHGKCEDVGVHCSSNCSAIVFCPDLDSEPIPVQECKNGLLCDPNTVKCTADKCYLTGNSAFTCTGTWIYPDLNHCGKSYICLNSSQIPAVECDCDEKSYFSTIDMECKEITATNVCTRQPVTCTPEDILPHKLADDPRYYYLCAAVNGVVDALVFRCPDGQIMDETTSSCVEWTETPPPTTTTTTTTTTPPTPPPTQPPPPPPIEQQPPLRKLLAELFHDIFGQVEPPLAEVPKLAVGRKVCKPYVPPTRRYPPYN